MDGEDSSLSLRDERGMRNLFRKLFGKEPVKERGEISGQSHVTATFKKGDLIGGDYVIYKLLGKGGFGEVYLAYIPESQLICALKTIRTELLPQPPSREAFKREALLWVNLEEHPFILVARHVFEFSRRLFVGMDYIAPDARGRVSLADHLAIARGPLDTDKCLSWAIQFCYGMEHALQRGIKCHRDIKPTNILVTLDGTLKISDFGLALAAQAAWKEEPGSVVTEKHDGSFGLSLLRADGKRVCGTPGYIAPEIFLGRQADVRSDIYSFGLVMWQMAKGSSVPPFHVPYEQVPNIDEYLRRVFNQQMTKHVPDAGSTMQSAIERCLLPEPSQRYGTFEELRSELELIYRRRTGRVIELPRSADRTAGLWNNKGVSLDELGRHEEAIACHDKALEIAPDSSVAWANKGHILNTLSRYESAIVCFDEAIRCYEALTAPFHEALGVNPESALAWANKGKALHALNRYDEALKCFAEAARINPRHANAWKGQALALAYLGRFQEAGACSEKAAELDPQWEDDLRQFSAVPGNHETALNTFRPGAAAWATKGAELAQAGRHEEALKCFVEMDPRYGAAWYNRGIVFSSLGRHEEALACYNKTLEIDPLFPEAWDRKGYVLGLLGRYEEAITCLSKGLEFAPENVAGWNNKGKALEALGRLDEAIPCFARALEIGPLNATVWDNKGAALREVGRYEEALACSLKAIEVEPRNPYFWCNKGAALFEIGQLEEALHCYATAVGIDPKYASAWNNKGIVLGALGRLDEAITCFDKALEIDPNFTAALENKRKAVEVAQGVPDVTDEDIPF